MTRVLAFLVVLVAAGSARADIITPDVSTCRDKKAGDACDMGSGTAVGVCQASTCSRRDYTNGPPGESVQYPCLRCLNVATPAPEPAPAPAPTNDKPLAPTPAAQTPAPVPAATPKPAAKGTGCAVDGGASAALGSLAVGALLLALVRRSRRT